MDIAENTGQQTTDPSALNAFISIEFPSTHSKPYLPTKVLELKNSCSSCCRRHCGTLHKGGTKKLLKDTLRTKVVNKVIEWKTKELPVRNCIHHFAYQGILPMCWDGGNINARCLCREFWRVFKAAQLVWEKCEAKRPGLANPPPPV